MFLEYIIIFQYFLLCVIIASVLFSISFFAVYQAPYADKSSTYECGFNP